MGIETLSLDGLIIGNPELQEGLTDVIPPGEIPAHYVNRYDAEYEVRCAFCDKHTPHKKGFTAQMPDGRTALCGRDCARKYFGEEVADDFEEKLEAQIRRLSKRKIVERTLDGVPKALAAIPPELLRMEKQVLRALSMLSTQFRNSGLSPLTDAGHYQLKETRRTWVERFDRSGKTVRVPVDTDHVKIEVKEALLLKMRGTPKAKLAEAINGLKMLASVDIEGEISDTIVERMTECRAKVIRDITNGMRLLERAERFLTKNNVKALSKLCEHVATPAEHIGLHKRQHGFDLVVTPEGMLGEDFYGGPQKETFPVPSFEGRPKAEAILKYLKEGSDA